MMMFISRMMQFCWCWPVVFVPSERNEEPDEVVEYFCGYVSYRFMVWIHPMVLVEVRVIVLFSNIISRWNIMLLSCLVSYYVIMYASYYISSFYKSHQCKISITVCGKPDKSHMLYNQFIVYACCIWYLTFILIFISL
jgi:hypothetical protein